MTLLTKREAYLLRLAVNFSCPTVEHGQLADTLVR